MHSLAFSPYTGGPITMDHAGRGTTVYRIIRFKECIQCIAWSDSRGPLNP